MRYVFVIGFIGVLVGSVFFRRKKQLRLIGDLKSSKLYDGLLSNGFKEVNENLILGNYEGYQVGFFYLETKGLGLSVYVTINCNIPFVKAKGGVKKMVIFSKKYKSLGYAIDSQQSFSGEISYDYILKSNYSDVNVLFAEIVATARKEGFDPV